MAILSSVKGALGTAKKKLRDEADKVIPPPQMPPLQPMLSTPALQTPNQSPREYNPKLTDVPSPAPVGKPIESGYWREGSQITALPSNTTAGWIKTATGYKPAGSQISNAPKGVINPLYAELLNEYNKGIQNIKSEAITGIQETAEAITPESLEPTQDIGVSARELVPVGTKFNMAERLFGNIGRGLGAGKVLRKIGIPAPPTYDELNAQNVDIMKSEFKKGIKDSTKQIFNNVNANPTYSPLDARDEFNRNVQNAITIRRYLKQKSKEDINFFTDTNSRQHMIEVDTWLNNVPLMARELEQAIQNPNPNKLIDIQIEEPEATPEESIFT